MSRTVVALAVALGCEAGTAAIAVAPGSETTTAVLFEEKFEDTDFAGRGWYDLPGGMSTGLTSAEHVSGSTRALAVHFRPGSTTPGVAGRHLFPETDAVYLRYWIKYSLNWIGSGKPYHPHELYFLTNEDPEYVGPAYTHLTLYVEHNYQNGGYPQLAAQDGANIDVTQVGLDLTTITERRAVAGCNGNSDGTRQSCYPAGGLYFNGKEWHAAQPVLSVDLWHKVEASFRLNTIRDGKGQPDGVAQYWLDGQLIIDRRDVLLRTGVHPNMRFRQFLLAPYIGDGSPVDQAAWIDDLVVMTARP